MAALERLTIVFSTSEAWIGYLLHALNYMWYVWHNAEATSERKQPLHWSRRLPSCLAAGKLSRVGTGLPHPVQASSFGYLYLEYVLHMYYFYSLGM